MFPKQEYYAELAFVCHVTQNIRNMVLPKTLARAFIYYKPHYFFLLSFYLYLNITGRDWGQEENGTTEDEMAGWHHRLDGHEFE